MGGGKPEATSKTDLGWSVKRIGKKNIKDSVALSPLQTWIHHNHVRFNSYDPLLMDC